LTKITIAAAQTIPEKGNINENLKIHEKLIRTASEKKADIIIFPEMSLTGYELDLAPELALSLFDKRLRPLSSLSANLGIVIIAGAPVMIESTLYIGAFILNPDHTTSLYLKHHLHPGEEKVFKPGHMDPKLYIEEEKISIAICADLTHAQHAENAAASASTLYLASAFITPQGYEKDSATLRDYARKYHMGIVLSNFSGSSGGHEAGGKTTIWSDAGEKVAAMEGHGEGLAIAKKENGKWSGKSMIIQ